MGNLLRMIRWLPLAFMLSPIFLATYLASCGAMSWHWSGFLGAAIVTFFARCIKQGIDANLPGDASRITTESERRPEEKAAES